MSKKILALILLLSLIPVLPISAAQEDYIFDTPVYGNYIFYNVNGENCMSDFFEYSGLGSDIVAEWTDFDGETGKVFRLFQPSAGASGLVCQKLKTNIPDRSDFTYSYKFRLVSMPSDTTLVLPTDNNEETMLLAMKGTTLYCGQTKISDLKTGEWYKTRLIKNEKQKKIIITDSQNKRLIDYSFEGGSVVAENIYFGFLAGATSEAEVIFDNFKIYTTNENYDESPLTPRYFSVFYSLKDNESTIKSIIGTNCAFTGDIYFYANGERRLYSDYGIFPVREKEKVYIPSGFFADALGFSYSVDEIGGINMSDYIRNINETSYIDTAAASKALGLYTYEDERGFVVSGETKCNLENSNSPFEIKESADNVYRYLHFDRADAGEILALASQSRPRILTNEAQLKKTLEYIGSDTTVSNWMQDVVNSADNLCTETTEYVEYELIGIRLLDAAREVLSRVTTLSSAYLLTEDEKYAQRGIGEMLNACSWTDWNASQHYLDNSELCYAMAIGFDSFYNVLTAEQKKTIMQKTTEHSLVNSVHAYEGTFKIGSEWRFASGNWGAVCPGGMTAALLSFAGEDYTLPVETQDFLLSNAMHSVEYPAMLFYPDGSWSEGPGYWAYTMQYFAGAFLGSLYFSTGSTWGFLRPEGVSECLNGFIHLMSESSGVFNFADSNSGFPSSPAGFLIAKITNDSSAMAEWKNMNSLAATSGNPYGILWYEPVEDEEINLPKDVWLRSAGAGVMRENWGDSQGAYVGVKGGQNNTNHDNLDLGSFIFDALGERWAMEVGKDNYNIEGGYWGLDGYTLYVKRPEGQNCLVINPEKGDIDGEYYQQKLDSFAEVSSFITKDKGAYMKLDLTDANSRDVTDYKRGYYFGDNRKSLIVQDELSLMEDNSTLYWSMHTQAEISIDEDKKGATLSLDGQELRVTLDTNADLEFSSEEATALPGSIVRPGEYSRAHINKLLLSGKGSGVVYITVKLTPQYDYVTIDESADFLPISQWSVPDGEFIEETRLLSPGALGRVDLQYDYDFCAYLPFDAQSCSLRCGDKVLMDFGPQKKGMQKLTVAGNSLNVMGDCIVYLRAQKDDTIKDSFARNVHFYKSTKRTIAEKINFEDCTVTSDISVIKRESGINEMITKNITDFSVEQMPGGNKMLCTHIKEQRWSDVPFIRKNIPSTNCTVVDFEFDFLTNGYGASIIFETRASDKDYASFDETASATVPVLSAKGNLGDNSEVYEPGTLCHVVVSLDMSNNYYCISTNGSVVREGSFFIEDMVYMGLNFKCNNAGGSKIFLDNISVSARCIADDSDGKSYTLGYHFDEDTPYTAYVAYYKGLQLVALDKRSGNGVCVKEVFEKKSVGADIVKTMILSDNLKPYKTICEYVE